MSDILISYSFDTNKSISITMSSPQVDAGYHFRQLDWAFTWDTIKHSVITYLPEMISIDGVIFYWIGQIREMMQDFEKAGSISSEDIDVALWLTSPETRIEKEYAAKVREAEASDLSFDDLLMRGTEILLERAENDEQRDFLRGVREMVMNRRP